MSRTPQTLEFGSLSTTTLTTIYATPEGSVVTPFLVATNNSSSKVAVSVYINNQSSDLLFCKKTIPAGVGKKVFFNELATQKINPFYEIKIQLDSAVSVNYFLSGSVIA